MADTYKTEGIILRRWDYKEVDRMFRILTKDYGKLTARAISCRKHGAKLAGHLEPFIHTDLFIANSRTIDIIAGSNIIGANTTLRRSLLHSAAASFFSEVVDRLTEEDDADPRLFGHVLGFYEWLNANAPNALALYAAILQLLGILGYHSELYYCHQCRRALSESTNKYHYKLWSAECANCASEDDTAELDERTIKVVRFLNEQPYEEAAKLKLDCEEWLAVDRFVRSLLHYNIEYDLRSEEVYRSLFRSVC
ncbi:MAG: DNA repair protein RecO [Candidatus Kerfeldbacteria bacterium]